MHSALGLYLHHHSLGFAVVATLFRGTQGPRRYCPKHGHVVGQPPQGKPSSYLGDLTVEDCPEDNDGSASTPLS